MAILKGFPPSNTVSTHNYHYSNEPEIYEIPILIKNLKQEEKFRTSYGEFMRMTNQDGHTACRGLCYKKFIENVPIMLARLEVGDICFFNSEDEVTWLRMANSKPDSYPMDCCQYCGAKLIVDAVSNRFGDWCPNEDCDGTKSKWMYHEVNRAEIINVRSGGYHITTKLLTEAEIKKIYEEEK